MALTYLLVDCMNGVLMRVGIGVSISQLFKMAMLAGILIFLLGKRPGAFMLSFGLILFFLIPLILKAMFTGDTSSMVGNFGYNLKLIFFPISLLFFSSLEMKEKSLKMFWSAFAWFNFWLIAGNILL